MHGANLPQVIAKAAKDEAIAKANERLGLIGDYRITDPLEAYETLVSDAEAWRQHCKVQLAELEEQYRYESAQGGTEQLRSEVGMWERALANSGKLLESWHKMGLDEHRMALAEADAQRLAGVFGLVARAFFASFRERLAMGLLDEEWMTYAEQDLVPELMHRELLAADALDLLDPAAATDDVD